MDLGKTAKALGRVFPPFPVDEGPEYAGSGISRHHYSGVRVFSHDPRFHSHPQLFGRRLFSACPKLC